MTNAAAPQPISESASALIAHSDPRWVRLREIILERSFQTGNFILSSGAKSTFLFQLRQTTMSGEGQFLISEIILDYLKANGIHCIGGPVQGAIPIGQSVLALAYAKGYDLDFFFVRKKHKEHGAKELIDGYARDNAEALIVDDVATQGNSIEQAIQGLSQSHPGAFVKRAIVVIDRQEGAAEMLAHKRQLQLLSIFKKSDFPIPA